MKKISLFGIIISSLVLLTGCMYPDSAKTENQQAYADQLETVQKAVEQYQKDSGGLLPIKTRDQEVDQYIKYPVEFERIIPLYLSKIPPNAYENGGIFQYVLTDVEENPTVKLVDLRTAEKIRELKLKMGINGYGPIDRQIADNVYTLNYEIMGYEEEQTVPSPYSDVNLPLIATGNGDVYIDYSIDLNRILQEEKPNVKPGDDIRFLLEDKYPVLPAYSLPYTVNEKNEPVFLTK
jgi:hypothetical protein